MSSLGDARIGTELLGYRIEVLVGRGGMGVVYRAFDSRLKRNVALKLLSADLAADEAFRERFLRESELAASLDHPNVVPIYEAGGAEECLFIAMRYVEGVDLKRRLMDGPLAPRATVELAAQVAGALDAAHAGGLVHRDVKPSNVLIAARAGPGGVDHVYLSDFGLTRRLADEAAALGSEPLMATLDYVAPEQIRGEKVDGRADVYSFGCLLYECLAGEPPFRASSDAALLFAHLEQDPPRLGGRGFPEALDPVLARALAKDPEERYPTAGELVDAARVALGIAAPTVWPWWRAAALLGLAGVALVAIGTAGYLFLRGPRGPALLAGVDSLVRIDPASDKVAASVLVGRKATGVAFGGGSVWVTNFGDGTVWRIDPVTRRVLARLPARGTPTGVAVYGSSVFVADGPDNSTIVALDAASGAYSYSTAMKGAPFGSHPQLAVDASGAWFADSDAQLVGQADAGVHSGGTGLEVAIPQLTGRTQSFRSMYQSFTGAAAGAGAVWVLGDALEHVVWRVDPAAGRIAARIQLPFAPRGIAVGEGGVWVTSVLDDTVSRIDPATNRIVATIRVGRGANQVATGAGGVWVTNEISGTVSRIDPTTGRVVRSISVGGSPGAIAVGGGAVWVVVGRR